MFLGAKVRRFLHPHNPYHVAFYIPHIWYIGIFRLFLLFICRKYVNFAAKFKQDGNTRCNFPSLRTAFRQ